MFTGIITSTGRVVSTNGRALEVAADVPALSVGGSVSVNGVCLTATRLTANGFLADVSEETRSRTTLGRLTEGAVVNIELPLSAGDPLGGHFVQGHVDGLATVEARQDLEGSVEMWFSVEPALRPYIAEKGSIALDGVSLTVAELQGDQFKVSLVPHTLSETNLSKAQQGAEMNVEVDVLAKYVERILNRTESQ